jgi:hypothetical protein
MSKPIGPIEEGWQSYLKNVVNPAASFRQIAEMRRVFYAGAMIAATECFSVGADVEEDEEKALAKLRAVNNDIESFQMELGAGANGVN